MRYLLDIPEDRAPEEVAEDLRELGLDAQALEQLPLVEVKGELSGILIVRLQGQGIQTRPADDVVL